MEEYKIAIVNCWSDTDKGGSAIIWGMIKSIRNVTPKARFSLISMYSESDSRYESAYRHLKKAFPDIHIYGSPIPTKDWSRDYYAFGSRFLGRMWILIWFLGKFLHSLIYLLVIRSHKFVSKKEAVQAIQEADIVLSAGGHYFRASRGISSFFELYFITYPLLIAWRLRKLFGLYGHTIGPFYSTLPRHFIRWLFSKATFIGVREDFSKEELIRYGILAEKIQIIPDTSFVIDPEFSDRVVDVLNQYGLEPQKFVAVTVRQKYKIELTINEYRRYLQELAKTIDFIVDKLELKVAIVLQNIRNIQLNSKAIQLNDDLNAGEQIFDLLQCRNKDKVVLVGDDLSPPELIALYGQALILVGARLHSIFFALMVGTPCIAIACSKHKIFGAMQILGLERYVLDAKDLKSSDLLMLIKELLTEGEREKVVIHIRAKVSILKKQALQVPQSLLSIIREGNRSV